MYYRTTMEASPHNHNNDGLLGLNSTMVAYMDPLRSIAR